MPQVRQTLANSGYVQCGSCRILSKCPLPPASTFRRSCSNTRSPISRRTLSGHDAAASAHHKDTLNTLGCASVPDKHCCCAAASNAEISVAEMHSLQRRDLAFFASCTRENASFGSLFLQAEHSEPPVAVGGFDHVSVFRSLGAVSRSPDAFGSIGAFVAADAAVVGPFCSAASKPRFVFIDPSGCLNLLTALGTPEAATGLCTQETEAGVAELMRAAAREYLRLVLRAVVGLEADGALECAHGLVASSKNTASVLYCTVPVLNCKKAPYGAKRGR